MKHRLIAACLSIACATVSPGAVSAQTPTAAVIEYTRDQARQDIRGVIEAFRTAIIDKDKPKFLALFPATGPVTWQNVIGDDKLRQLRLDKPQASKAARIADKTHLSFIDGIVGDEASKAETFDNIRIDTDGEIASVTFDYRFLSDGRETNRGREAWHLVRTDAGWQIVSVIWSERWPMPSAT
jgi:hypothetical protein